MNRTFMWIGVSIVIAYFPAKAETALEVKSSCKAVLRVRDSKADYLNLPRNFDAGFCWGAFASLQEISSSFPEGETSSLLGCCPPPDSTRLQYIRIFSKYVDDHPEAGQEDFVTVAIQSLQLAFPCHNKRTSLRSK